MKFDMRSFVMKGLLSAIGVQSDFWVILEAAKWYEKGVLLDENLEEINRKIDEKNAEIERRKQEQEEQEQNAIENMEDEEVQFQ